MTTAVTAAPAAAPAVAPVEPAAVTPPVAPVAAPVVAPAPEIPVIGEPAAPAAPAPAAPVAPAAPNEIVTYEPTGDAGLDVALGFVGKLGISMDHPAMQATANGDFSLIKAHLATMGDKAQGWEQMVALAEASHTRSQEAAVAKATAIQNAVHSIAGGPENWATVVAWAGITADPAEKEALNAMFDAGPVQARAAAQMLVDLHSKAAGVTLKPASAVTLPGASDAPSNVGPLSVRDYSNEVQKLANKIGGHNLATSPEYHALGKRLATK